MLKDVFLLLYGREQGELSIDFLILSFTEGLDMTNCKSGCFTST